MRTERKIARTYAVRIDRCFLLTKGNFISIIIKLRRWRGSAPQTTFFTIITMKGVGYGVQMNCKLLFNTQHWWHTKCCCVEGQLYILSRILTIIRKKRKDLIGSRLSSIYMYIVIYKTLSFGQRDRAICFWLHIAITCIRFLTDFAVCKFFCKENHTE